PGGVSGTSRRAGGGPDGTDGTAPDGTSPGGSGTPGVGTSRPRGSCATAEQESHEPNDDTWPVAATSGREQAHPYEPAARTTERKSNLLWVTFMPRASSNDMHSISIVNVSIWSVRETEGWRGRNCPSARGGVAIAEVARAGRTGGLPAMRKRSQASALAAQRGAFSPGSHSPRADCSAMTAYSVSLAAVTPIRSKHSATMLLVAVSKLIRRSIEVMTER